MNSLSSKDSTRQNRKHYRTLVVDGEAASVDTLSRILRDEGHEVLQACDHGRALVLLARSVFFATVPDMIFVDLLIPDPALSEFAAKVRALPSPRPWMIGMSPAPSQPAALDNADEFLSKPVTAESVRSTIEKVEERIQELTSQRSVLNRSPDGRPLPPSPPLIAVVDPDVLSNLRETTSRVSLHHLYQTCIEDSRGRIAAMHELVALDEPDRVRRLAHEMKESAAMVGAAQLYALAESIESGAYNKDAMPYRLNEMEAACTRIRRILVAGFLDK